jgi:alpha-N-arabinofuranosidase
VRLWEVGNELWGTFQINWATSEDYGERFARFAEAMKAADPSIQLIAIGGDMPGALLQKAQGEAMPSLGAEYARHALAKAGDKAWAIAEHAVMGGVLRDASADEAYLSLVAHAHHVGMLLEENRRRLAELAPHVLVTQTEQMVAVGGPDRPSDSSLTAAVVWATFANWFLRSDGFVPLFTRSAMINHGDLLAKERGVVYPFPGYHGQAMYANQPGRTPVRVEMEGPVMRVPAGPFPAAELPCLDAVGLLSVDGEHLAVLLVNRHPEQRIETELEPAGFAPSDRAEVQVLGAARYSERNTWYAPDHVKPFVEHRPVREGRLRIAVPPHSVCVVVFKRASGALA